VNCEYLTNYYFRFVMDWSGDNWSFWNASSAELGDWNLIVQDKNTVLGAAWGTIDSFRTINTTGNA
ncbi:unnamed protein product, partial [marine sediment metagenome]